MHFMGNTLQPSLLDTNILVYANNADSPFHIKCKALVESVLSGDISGFVTVQNLMELYAVITDRRRVAHPLTPAEASGLIRFYVETPNLSVIAPDVTTLPLLYGLIRRISPQAQSIFDLLLIAVMLEHGISTIYTANTRHFIPFQELTVINPTLSDQYPS